MSDESLVIQCPVCDGRKSHAHCVGDLLATPDAGAREAEIARVISSEIGDAIAAHEAGEGEAAVSKRGETVARWIMDRTHPTPPSAASPELEAVDALVRTIATEAYKHWVADRDSKVGKLLAALAGTTGIRLDLDGVCAAAPRADVSELSREQLERAHERLRQKSSVALAFYDRYKKPPLALPSCFRCGKQASEVSVQHMELPSIVLCTECSPHPDAPGGR